MSAKVADLTALQDKIQRYRPWYDNSFPALTILRQLTMAFPEDGEVTAKTIEIHDGNQRDLLPESQRMTAPCCA